MCQLISVYDEKEKVWVTLVPRILTGGKSDVYLITKPKSNIVKAIQNTGFTECQLDDILFIGPEE